MIDAIPVWVPIVLLLLIWIGYRQSLTRDVRPGTLVAVALGMFAFSLYGVAATFGAAPVALSAWASGYALAAVGGARLLFAGGLQRAAGAAVRVPGSWVPMALLLSVFAAKTVLGFAAGLHSALMHETWFIGAMSGVLGLLSGGFGARAVAVRRVARSGCTAMQRAA